MRSTTGTARVTEPDGSLITSPRSRIAAVVSAAGDERDVVTVAVGELEQATSDDAAHGAGSEHDDAHRASVARCSGVEEAVGDRRELVDGAQHVGRPDLLQLVEVRRVGFDPPLLEHQRTVAIDAEVVGRSDRDVGAGGATASS